MNSVMDENARRYYLDAMGIQCWELLPPESQHDASVSESSDREVAVTSYAGLEASIQSCTKCVLHKTRAQAIAGRGNQSADLMFVTLSPNESDEANALFSKMLAAINIGIDDVYITSLLKCSVPASHPVSATEIQICNTYLKQQMQLMRPELLVVLGETAACRLLQKELSMDESRAMNGALSQQLDSVPLFFSYSPEELLQQPENKRKAWTDLQQLQKIIKE